METESVDWAEDEFRQFYLACWRRLLRTAVLLTGDHARGEDLTQITMMRVHRHWRRVKQADAPEAYARRILVNQYYSWWRRRRPEILTSSVPDSGIRDRSAAVDLHDEMWTAVLALPPRMRAVVVLRYFEDLSEQDTAAILGCSVGAVKSQTSRALRKLRVNLSDPVETRSAVS